ncbi:right-handed parallel beta-helix repeat-containing protein [Streptomyces sp. T028]|uniref:right-handed parallel beta-helix repeat-containing protein n=1 Tax=Streptomyces sp. T028 TaxID=3394379 RepID=UPI003A892524
MLTVKNMRALAAAALVSVCVPGIALSTTAQALPARKAVVVPCGDVTGLIARITAANAVGGGSILLAPGCTYALNAPTGTDTNGANGLPVISGRVTLIGRGATISRTGTAAFRVAEVAAQGSLTLNGITVSGGSATEGSGTAGGGILTAGTLVLVNSRITHNTASGAGGGIAVASGATATLSASTVSDNSGGDGGGVHVGDSARLTMAGGAVKRNKAVFTGGGLNTFGTAVLNGTAVTSNSTQNFEGGGVFTAFGTLTVNGGRVTENEAASSGGGIANHGSQVRLLAVYTASNRAGLDGGGLYQLAGSSSLVGGVVTGNQAGGAGGGVFRVVTSGPVRLLGAFVLGNQPDNCAPAGAVLGCPA